MIFGIDLVLGIMILKMVAVKKGMGVIEWLKSMLLVR